MNLSLDYYVQALQERASQDNLRSLRASRPLPYGQIELSGKELVNFASNDYLGLSQDLTLIARANEYAQRYGVGSGSSRLLSGNLQVFEKIENKLARLKGTEAALILPTGFQANSSVIPAIVDKKSVAAADRLIHRSMAEGLLLSSARWFRFAHNDFRDMEERLKRFDLQTGARWLITESVFSADGDWVDIDALLALAKRLGLALFVDEAHATGLFGLNGMGLTAGKSIPGISMGTFGKGLGSFGAYVCCSNTMRDYLINFCPGLIYSTALPPPVLGAIDAALDLVPEMDLKRQELQDKAERLRVSLKSMGFDTGLSTTHIIPIIVGSAGSALSLSSYLEKSGFYVPAIRPPTVPNGSARLRLSLTAVHTNHQIENFLSTLRNWHEEKH